jgi:single-stranded-DNA-specific exonuclease
MESKETIVIHGDYDADGVCGSALLMSVFRQSMRMRGLDPALLSSYLPHRENEGYGIRVATVEKLAAQGTTLMITVDCGISCRTEIARAAELGMDTIVVDHHQIPEKIPECIILHPLVEGETYPYKSLAAVGVSYKFACAFIAYSAEKGFAFEPGYEKWLLDLVSIATVTDVMPLVGENRTLEKYGLIVLNKTKRPGLRALIEAAGLQFGKLDTVSVGFSIGPRINAAGRMDHARAAFDTLVAEDEASAKELAERLNQLNRDRQQLTERVVREARAMAKEAGPRKVQVIAGEGWPAGIVGLIAGRLVNDLGVPTFVFGREGDHMVGSGRSVPGFNLVAAMDTAAQHLVRYGGHPQACGLTISGDANLQAFRECVERYADEQLEGRDLRPFLRVDAELRTSQITWELAESILALEPHGEGNPRPVFLLRDVLVSSVTPVGKDGKHVRIGVRGDTPKEWKVIAFGKAEQAREFPPGCRADVLVELGFNEWNGTREIQLRAVDFRHAV